MTDLVNRKYLGDLLAIEGDDRSLSNTHSLGDAIAEVSLAIDLLRVRYHDQVMIDFRETQVEKEGKE